MRTTKKTDAVRRLYVTEGLTPKAIAARLEMTSAAVRMMLSRLRKNGLLSPANTPHVTGGEGGVTFGPNVTFLGGPVRLHAQQFVIRVISTSVRYERERQKHNVIANFEGAYVVLHKDRLEVYSKTEFSGDTAHEAAAKAAEFWTLWARKLEARLRIIILKRGVQNWRMVKSGEYARGDSAAGKYWMQEEGGYKVTAPEDGKVFYWVDWSRERSGGGPEDETMHPETSLSDREIIDRHYRAWRSRPDGMTTAELQDALKETVRATSENARQLREFVAALSGLSKPAPAPLSDEEPRVKPWYVG